MLELGLILLFAFLGVMLGTLTGLVPGLHVNTIAILLLSASPAMVGGLLFLSDHGIDRGFIVLLVCITIFATSIAHTFLDFIPSTFLGVPEGETALSVLPAHSMVLEGKGYRAVVLSAVGSMGAVACAFLFMIPYRFILGNPVNGYVVLREWIVPVLLGVVVLILVSETRKVPYRKVSGSGCGSCQDGSRESNDTGDTLREEGRFSRALGVGLAVFVFVTAGLFGLVIFRMEVSSPFGLPSAILFPALSGMFGLATLLVSLKDTPTLPPQDVEMEDIDGGPSARSVASGAVAGSAVGFLPGLSAGLATVIAMAFRKENDREQVILTLSSINTANAFFVMVALFLILRPRSGAAIVVDQLIDVEGWNTALPPQAMVYILIGGLFAAALAFVLTIRIGAYFARVFDRVPYRKLLLMIICSVIALVYIFTGFVGLGVLVVSTFIGLLPQALGVRRSHAMGILLLPVIVMLW